MPNSLRLGNLVKEFNVSACHIIDFLADKGFTIEKNLHLKLSQEAYALLQEEFKSDKIAREQVDQISDKYPSLPLPYLNSKCYERICFKCDNCNTDDDMNSDDDVNKEDNLKIGDNIDEKDSIIIRDSDFVLQSNESLKKVWWYELDFRCEHCRQEINLHFEIQVRPMWPNAVWTRTISLKGANIIDCPKRTIDEEEQSSRNRESSFDPYEDFHWGDLSGEEAYIAYWNTD